MVEKAAIKPPSETERGGLVRSPIMLALWAGLGVSLLGDQIYRVVLAWTLTVQLGSVSNGIWLGLAMALPTAVLGIFGGVLVDRADRFGILIVSDLVRALVVGAIALIAIEIFASTAAVIAGAFVLAAAGVCFTPALQASLPDIVGEDRDRLIAFDALILSTMSVTGILGPALASVLLPAVGVSWLLAFDAISFIASAAAVILVRRKRPAPQGITATVASAAPRNIRAIFSAAREGLRFILGHPVLRPQFLVFPFMESAAYSIIFVLPGYVKQNLSSASWLFGVLLGGYAVGRVVGSWLMAHSSLKARRGKVLAVNFIWQGIAMCAFVAAPNWWSAVICYALIGLPGGASQVALSSFLQTEIPAAMRGRCFAAITSFVTWLMPLGPIVFGTIAAWQGVRVSLALIGIVFTVGGLFICAHRSVRKVS